MNQSRQVYLTQVMRLIIFSAYLITSINTHSTPIIIAHSEFDSNIDKFLTLYFDETGQLGPKEVLMQDFSLYNNFKYAKRLLNKKGHYWFQLAVNNSLDEDIEVELTQWSLDQPCLRVYEILPKTKDQPQQFIKHTETLDRIHSTYLEYRRIFRLTLKKNTYHQYLITNELEKPDTCKIAHFFSFQLRSLPLVYHRISLSAFESGLIAGLYLTAAFIAFCVLRKLQCSARTILIHCLILTGFFCLNARFESIYSPLDQLLDQMTYSGELLLCSLLMLGIIGLLKHHKAPSLPIKQLLFCNVFLISSIGLNCDWIGSTLSSNTLYYALNYLTVFIIIIELFITYCFLRDHKKLAADLPAVTHALGVYLLCDTLTNLTIQYSQTPAFIVDHQHYWMATLTVMTYICYLCKISLHSTQQTTKTESNGHFQRIQP